MKFRFLSFCIFLSSLSSYAQTIMVKSENISPRALFSRCYTQITGKQVPFNNTFQFVVETHDEAIAECSSLLDAARLDLSSGTLTRSDAVSKDILNNFFNFHRSWFKADTIQKENALDRENLFFDHTEPALYLSRAFMTGDSYESILSYNQVPMALRAQKERTEGAVVSTEAQSILVQQGELEGIRWRTNQHSLDLRANTTFQTSGNETRTWPVNKIGDSALNLMLQTPNVFRNNEHFGGGILGSPIYFTMNTSENFGGRLALSTNPIRIPRRWARNLMSDLLCRDLPLLRIEDVTNMVQLASETEASFRNSSSCMQCHATMDTMTAVARNIAMTRVDSSAARNARSVYFPKKLRFDSSRSVSIMDLKNMQRPLDIPNIANLSVDSTHSDFFATRPTGKLFMRSYNGSIINRNIVGITGLANSLKSVDDLYVCAAKRYFNFFTGINVSLEDIGSPKAASITPEELKYRALVEKLGLKFKQHQNIKQLIKDIMKLKLYKRIHMRLLQGEKI